MLASDEDDLPLNFGEMLGDTLQGQCAPDEKLGIIVAGEFPKSPSTLSKDQKMEALRSCNSMRQRLSGLLQAQTMRNGRIGRSGKLHTPSLHRLFTGSPKIFQREIEKPDLDTAVHILLDCSSSMVGNSITLACEACYAVAVTLQGIKGITPAVTAFPANYEDNSVFPLVRHGQRIPDTFALDARGDTPLAPALLWVMREMLNIQADRKIILILTDGIPNSIPATEYALKEAKRFGYEVHGIGIMSRAVERLHPSASKVIWKISELAPAMFSILQNSLFKGGLQ